MQLERPYVLSIAGLDPSAGAGLLADIKTFESLKVYGLGVTSAITIQDDEKVYGINWLSFDDVMQQADVLFNKFNIEVCKIGIMPDKDMLLSVIAYLKNRNSGIKIIVDPVLKSSSGFDFYKKEDLQFWKTVTEQITLLTPNYTEMDAVARLQTPYETAQAWSLSGNILIKGGHSVQNPGIDRLFSGGKEHLMNAGVSDIHQKHGSGCVLSSAIVAYLALNFSLPESCRLAKRYTECFLNSNNNLLGFHS